MNVFLVHAHPEPKSFCSALAHVAEEELAVQGHSVRVSDLYAMKFDPVASAEDFENRERPDYLVYALEQRHGYEGQTIAADIRGELEKVLWCDLLLLNFPIFWFSTPAILKGWIDRVLISGLCYGGKRFYDRGGLRGKKAMVTATLGGRPHMFGLEAVHGPLEDMLRHLLRGTLYYVGLDVLTPFFAYHVPYVEPKVRAQMLVDYHARLRELETLPSLAFPSLNEFDDKLFPITPPRAAAGN